jgi:predicted dehydrogenase
MSDRKIRIAVLGAALFAETGHIPGLRSHAGAEVVALYSRDLARAGAMAERASVPEATDDLDALLARDDIDAVTIVSSNDRHRSDALAALRAGKHVFCEKPMALNTEEAAEMTREARRRGVVHQVGFTFRYTYCLEEMRRRVVAGDVGTPHFVEIQSEWLTRFTAGEAAATWRDSLSLHGSGHLGEMGSHFIDTVNFVCGPSCGFIGEVAAVIQLLPREVKGADGQTHRVDTPDLAAFLFRTERGLQGQVFASRITPPPISYGIVHWGERQRGHFGYAIVTGDRGGLMATFTRGEGDTLQRTNDRGRWERIELPPEASDGQPHGVSRMMHAFVESVLRGRTGELDATFDDGYRSQSAVDAILAASASKRWEPVMTKLE